MNFLSRLLLAILLVGSLVYGNTHGTTRRSRSTAIGKTSGKTLDSSLSANVFSRRKRQTFHDMSGDPSLVFFHHLSEHGTFNQDTHSCDEVMSRPCKRPSDCHGCLGLFTCKLPQGRCDFKGVSKRTGIFYQSLQKDEASDVNAH